MKYKSYAYTSYSSIKKIIENPHTGTECIKELKFYK